VAPASSTRDVAAATGAALSRSHRFAPSLRRFKPAGEIGFVLAICCGAVLLWHEMVIGVPVTFWGIPGDWSVMSLAEAVNIDFWLRGTGPRALSQAQYYQPGVWYQFVSYIVYRTTSSEAPAREIFQTVLRDPQHYWNVLQILPIAMTAFGSGLIWRASRGLNSLARCAAISCYFICMPAVAFGIYQYFNESFTLAIAACFFPMGLLILTENQRRPSLNAFLCGLAASGLYLHKMNYVVWAVALIPAIFAAAWTGRFSWTAALIRALLLVAGITLGVLGFGYFLLGPAGLQMMLAAHKEILLGSGIYGQGDHTVVSLKLLLSNATIVAMSDYYFTLMLAACALLGIGVFLRNVFDRAWLRQHMAEGVFLFAAAAAMLLAVLKHYQPYYIVSVAAVLPFIVIWLARARMWIIGPVALALTGLALVAGIPGLVAVQHSWAATETKMAADHEFITSRPLKPQMIRLWMYRSVDPFCGRLFLVNFTGISSLIGDVWQLQGPQLLVSPWHASIEGISGYKDMKDVPWQSIVVDKTALPYIDKKAHPWVDDPRMVRTELQQVVLFERDVAAE
jgi:hypothetical protein